MAMLGRKQPAAPPSSDRPKTRPAAAGTRGDDSRVGKFRGNIDAIMAELRKVAWPTREETRNLTIVVIGISATIGLLLGGIDYVLSQLYAFFTGLAR